jgi:3-oxoacyl-[acyl-carrier protein] reductase
MSKKVVVTGASRGIGYELVKKYASKGFQVLAISRDSQKLEALINDCKRTNKDSRVDFLALDLSKESFDQILSNYIKERYNSIDILINNAGSIVVKPFTEISALELQRVYQVNILSVFKTIQSLMPLFSSEAHIVNISSVGGVQGSAKFPGLSAYSSSKAALVGLTECLAEEYKETLLSFNCLALGAVQTEMLEEAFPGYRAPLSARQMADYICDFSLNGQVYYNGKILPVSKSTP